MKTNRTLAGWLTLLALATLNLQPSTAFAQGSLTPPGAPGPTMKSLDQVEPRTIVNAANTPGDSGNSFIISQPGSYYLAANLTGVSGKNGIEIVTNNVTLDLNGFALSGVPGPYNGVCVAGTRTNIVVCNGSISGWGSEGVYSSSGFNLRCERLNVSSCYTGIYTSSGMVSDCSVQSCSVYGIHASSDTVSDCTVQSCGSGGISANSSTVSGCTIQSCGTEGIYALSSTVTGCQVAGCTYSGIFVDAPGCVIVGNNCKGNNTGGSPSNAGIYIDDANNRIEDNHVTANGYAGIQVNNSYINNVIIKNTVMGNGANNYVTPGNQVVGPLIANTVSGVITNANPWANFSF